MVKDGASNIQKSKLKMKDVNSTSYNLIDEEIEGDFRERKV